MTKEEFDKLPDDEKRRLGVAVAILETIRGRPVTIDEIERDVVMMIGKAWDQAFKQLRDASPDKIPTEEEQLYYLKRNLEESLRTRSD